MKISRAAVTACMIVALLAAPSMAPASHDGDGDTPDGVVLYILGGLLLAGAVITTPIVAGISMIGQAPDVARGQRPSSGWRYWGYSSGVASTASGVLVLVLDQGESPLVTAVGIGAMAMGIGTFALSAYGSRLPAPGARPMAVVPFIAPDGSGGLAGGLGIGATF